MTTAPIWSDTSIAIQFRPKLDQGFVSSFSLDLRDYHGAHGQFRLLSRPLSSACLSCNFDLEVPRGAPER